jgi:hypothetical protein
MTLSLIWRRVVLAFTLFMMISVPAAATPAPESGRTIDSPTSDNVVAPEHQSVNSANREVAQVGNTLWVGIFTDSTLDIIADERNACTAKVESENPAKRLADKGVDAPMDPGRDIEYRIDPKVDQAWT